LDYYTLIVPSKIPDWMVGAEPWWETLKLLDGKRVLVISDPQPGSALWSEEDGTPDLELHPKRATALFVNIAGESPMIPWEWLEGVKIPCNCQIQTIIARGCREPNHI